MVCAERDGVLHGLSRPASIRYRQPDLRGDELTVGNGKVFTVTASDVSSRNRFVQSAMLNGKPLNKPWFTQNDIAGGGTLVSRVGQRGG
jgi:putative alpha-1,2-mannosidase